LPRQVKRRRQAAELSPPWLRFIVVVLSMPISGFFRLRWHEAARIPASGPAIIVANHISYADPLVLARFIYDAGRVPRFLAKRGLFRIAVMGHILRGAGQIPVDRASIRAKESLDGAVAALRRGELVIIYPEGTVTRDRDWWPMRGKNGAARLALLAPDVPVIPIAQWGAQDAIDWYNRRIRPLPRKLAAVRAGEPIDLERFRGAEPNPATLREMTDQMTAHITALLADLRGEPIPGSRS
jgi:1-acyl-sn-glycerol-3-phosphate acyltransferase